MKSLLNRLLSFLLLWSTAWAPPPEALAQSATNKDKIALVMKALSNPFFFKMEAGAKEYAHENDIHLEIFGTELETDIERQLGIFDNLVSRGYGAIVIAPIDSRKLAPALKKAIDQGIVIVNIDNPLDKDIQAQYGLDIPFVGSDNTKGGALIGDYLRRQLHGKGKIIVIEGIRGAKNGELRKAGFLQAVTVGGGIELVDSVSGNWHAEDAFAQMSSLLEKHGSVDAVFCANDQMALGVLQALDARNLTGKVLVSGYDNIEAIHNELRNGRMHATVEQHPELMGYYGVALANQAMRGKKIPAYQETPLDLISHESFGKRIAFSVSEQANPFFSSMLAGALAHAGLHGVELLHADAKNDDSQQLLAINNFVTNKVDALIINPTNSQAVQPGIEIANHARIPVITTDRRANGGKVIAHVASDNVAGGRLAGEYIARKLAEGGTIAEFEGIPGTSVSYERSEGFNEIISKNKNLRIKTREVAHFDRETARDIMARLLAQGQTFDAVFAHNDSMILGVLDALQQAGLAKWPILVGFDAIPEALQALREGRLSATIAQKPERMGVLAVDLALKALREEPMPAFVPVELDLIETSK